MCTNEKVIKNVEVKVDVQKGAVGFREEKKMTIDVLVSSNSHVLPLLSYGNSPQCLPCPFLLGFTFGF